MGAILSGKDEFNLYNDMKTRTKGEIYIGVVGPVRTGKSTFIKRFMDLMVLPHMQEENKRTQLIDELPQSAHGKTIMTTEPKFVPKDAAAIRLSGEVEVKVRLIDCVGFMVEGASGHIEDGGERMVRTPWFDYEVPFVKAAEIGTQKVIRDHSTIGIVVTTDGSFTDIERTAYEQAEEQAVSELKRIGKPFILLLNSLKPYSEETKMLAGELEQKYGVGVLPVNCDQMHKEDIDRILESILYEFPVTKIDFFIPKWMEMMENTHPMKAEMIEEAKKIMEDIDYIKDISSLKENFLMRAKEEENCIDSINVEQINLSEGTAGVRFLVLDKYYYENISELTGTQINGEYQLIAMLKELSASKKEYGKVSGAIESVRQKGYGVVTPELSEVVLEAPVVIKQGNKFGVKIKAQSPSIHMIKANIETEIAPIIGSQEQAEELVKYLQDSQETEEGIWETNIFGKSVGELVEDGIRGKITQMDEESQMKLQDTMQKVVNDMNGGIVCIII
ncbi:MAG: stage IV sporulation protein A [Eubacterium sp.]|nr:stage IV sporulation protein A [Eubacterium sp.]